MLNDKALGIYIHANKTFYYLEAGGNYIGNSLDRVRKALIQRNLIVPDMNTNYAKASYDIISYGEAFKNDYSLQPIFLSQHIKKLHDKNKENLKGKFK
jgi:hypothetical protein